MTPTGLLLINLGTPLAPTTPAVRRYLRQFLADKRVLDINPLLRFFLARLIIPLFRAPKSAEAYRKVWTSKGSPLLVESEALTAAVKERLGERFVVALGMRYGKPSLEEAWSQLEAKRVERVVVVPLYPQYSAASTGTALEEVFRIASTRWVVPSLQIVPPFYEHPAFINAFTEVARPVLERERPEHVLFSYHGLPERHMHKSDPSEAHCLSRASCCDTITEVNQSCYRAQCMATTRALSKTLELSKWSVSFQSRLGRDPWIKPYTDLVLPELAKQGVKRLAVLCPAFVADCLETLEEVEIRAKETFLSAGGESFALVPSLNAHPAWVEAVLTLIKEAQGSKDEGV